MPYKLIVRYKMPIFKNYRHASRVYFKLLASLREVASLSCQRTQ